jgi:hypothetical protein
LQPKELPVIRNTSKSFRSLTQLVLLAAGVLHASVARADVTLLEKDDWTVFTNGRIQGFFSYANGGGYPEPFVDKNGKSVSLWGGGVNRSDALVDVEPSGPVENPDGSFTPANYGKINEMRFRSGFVGNVLGFGVKKQLNANTFVQGYFALAATIQPPSRRKYTKVYPDAREGHMQISGPWGSVRAGRMLTLLGRGNTEITYLYGYAYGLGFPGSVSEKSEPFPTAGHVGFGVLGNGFGAGASYDTPSLAGLQATFAIFDANTYPNNGWERARWPRPEVELTWQKEFGTSARVKVFANAALQKLYRDQESRDTTVKGAGYGARVEVGPVHLGLAGHYGEGIGFNYAFEPSDAMSDQVPRGATLRTVDGYYGQLQVVLGAFDLQAGAGVSRVHLLDTDRTDMADDDMNPATPAGDDDGAPGADSTGFTPIRQQLGLSAGVVYHVGKNLHLDLDYFNANYQWYDTAPKSPHGAPEQKIHFVNAGATFDW